MSVKRRVAVTGATGFIGRHLSAQLVTRSFEVRAIVRPSTASSAVRATSARAAHPESPLTAPPPPRAAASSPAGSMSGRANAPGLHPDVVPVPAPLEARALTDAFRGVDSVVHLAGVIASVDEAEYAKVNVAGTRAVAEAARAVDARLVHVSSLAAAGPSPPLLPRSEDDPPAPLTPYGRSKLESERAVAGVDGLRWIVLRPGAVYGPGDRALLPLFRFARSGVMPLVGRPTAAYTFVHVADVVRAIEAALDAEIGGETIFVGAPAPISARALLEHVRAAAGARALIVRIPRPLTGLAACAGDLAGRLRGRPLPLNRWRYCELYAEGFACRVDRLRERLGVVAQIDLSDGLAQTAAWYREHGWL